MRRLTESRRDDQGVATIFIILAMLFLFAGAGLAIDVGHYVAEDRAARTSADATALAMGTDCALDNPLGSVESYATYFKSGQDVTRDTESCSGKIKVTVAKTVTDGLLLRSNAGFDVDRDATVEWGTLSKATVLPITIASCEFTRAESTSGPITIYVGDPKKQSSCSSLPGGFGQLEDEGCAVTVTAGTTEEGVGEVDGDPGGDLHKQVPCLTPLPREVLIPIYDSAACDAAECTGHGPYQILGFAVFLVTGYSFNGNNYSGTLGDKCPDQNTFGKYCIQGDFIDFVTSQGETGPSEDFGTLKVYLTG